MIQQIENTFLTPYLENDFLTTLRARTLLYFNLILISIMPVMLILLNVLISRPLFSLLNIVLSMIIITAALSLGALKRGHYFLAANLIVIIIFTAYSIYSIFGTKQLSVGAAVSGHHLLIFIIFSALFCGRTTTLTVSLAALAVAITGLSITEQLTRKEAVTVGINLSFDIIVTAVLCYQLININRKTREKLKKEADMQEYYEAIQNLLASVKDIAQVLASSSSEMSSTSLTFSHNAQDQASSAEEITATVEELSAGHENVARSTELQKDKITSLTSEMEALSSLTSDMNSGVKEALGVASSIADQARNEEQELQQMRTIMHQINERSREMTSIISIINDISDQINLLSLNAAIEAARAGDAGRGFAVVADEISKLADQTTRSVKDIDTLIKASEGEVNQGIASVEQNVIMLTRFIEGITSINQVVVSLSEFMGRLSTSNSNANSIAGEVDSHAVIIRNATAEQKTATAEIVKSLAVINELTQANATGAEEMAGGSEELSGLADQLRSQVNNFSYKKD